MTIVLITGIQAAGKSTVAQAVAERIPRSVHVRGDIFRRFVVNGRSEMGPGNPPAEAIDQLRLRYRIAASVAEQYEQAGFTVVLQDIAIGEHLTYLVNEIHSQSLRVVVLAPSADTVVERDLERQHQRGKIAYRPADETIQELDHTLRNATPRIGRWIDSSNLNLEQTVAMVIDFLNSDDEQ